MVEMIKVSVEYASEQLFAPFGHLIARPSLKPNFATKGYSSWRYPLHLTGTPDLTLLHYNHRPMICRGLELHPFLTELRVPLDHKPSLIFVAVADQEPQPSDVRAFLVPGDAAVLIAHHCWHSGFYPLDPCGADYILLSDLETEAELEAARPGKEFRRTRFIDWSERAELVADDTAACIQKSAFDSKPQR
jgi:ureidoglycolate hydrolase